VFLLGLVIVSIVSEALLASGRGAPNVGACTGRLGTKSDAVLSPPRLSFGFRMGRPASLLLLGDPIRFGTWKLA
jgi:hypothetical protein